MVGRQDDLEIRSVPLVTVTISRHGMAQTHVMASKSIGGDGLVVAVVCVATHLAIDDMIGDLLLPITEHRQWADCGPFGQRAPGYDWPPQ